MSKDSDKILIGILGGVGSGKSSVALEFEKLGCGLVDADKFAHEALQNNNVKEQLSRAFGGDIFDKTGRIDRSRLAEKAFSSKENVEKINSIIHPQVIARCEELIREFAEQKGIKAIVLDVPLLAEVGLESRCDILVFVDCSDDIRYKRLSDRGAGDMESIKKREKFQFSLDKKRKIAHYIISNNSTLSDVVEQVERIFSFI